MKLKSNYCEKPIISPAYNESICQECDFEDKTLKSLEPYWRTWPDSKPVLGATIILQHPYEGGGRGGWLKTAVFSKGWNDEDIFVYWGTQIERPRDGDRWLPLSALKFLNEIKDE